MKEKIQKEDREREEKTKDKMKKQENHDVDCRGKRCTQEKAKLAKLKYPGN